MADVLTWWVNNASHELFLMVIQASDFIRKAKLQILSSIDNCIAEEISPSAELWNRRFPCDQVENKDISESSLQKYGLNAYSIILEFYTGSSCLKD